VSIKGGDIPPEWILSGLGALGREELASFLALLASVDSVLVLWDAARDRFDRMRAESERIRLEERVRARRQSILDSGDSADRLRLMLWTELNTALGCELRMPLSTRSARLASTALAIAATDRLWDKLVTPPPAGVLGMVGRAVTRAAALAGRGARDKDERPGFGKLVGIQAAKLSGVAYQQGEVSDEALNELLAGASSGAASAEHAEVLERLRAALQRGDRACVASLLASGGLLSLAAAVEVSGFAAYILAAKLSAFVPLLSGVSAVSILAVLANPLTAVLATGGVLFWGRRRIEDAAKDLAATIVTVLAIRGMASREEGLAACIDAFKTVEIDVKDRRFEPFRLWRERVCERLCVGGPRSDRPFLPTPGRPPGALGRPLDGNSWSASSRRGAAPQDGVAEFALGTGLTIGDIAFAAASIDPRVVAAVDFARTDVHGFWSFLFWAGQGADLPEGELTRLTGYVAERVVAIMLAEKGHNVEFPDVPNNPGIDLFVDGQPLQVKCVSSLHELRKHFALYPDIPVYVNYELYLDAKRSGADWEDDICSDPEFTKAQVEKIFEDSRQSSLDLIDLDIFHEAIGAPLIRCLALALGGRVAVEDVPFEVALRMITSGSAAFAGGLAGQLTGLALFGPAGAIVFGKLGALAALAAGPALRKMVDRHTAPEWFERLDRVSARCADAIARAALEKAARFQRKLATLGACGSAEAAWLALRLHDEYVFFVEGALMAADIAQERDPIARSGRCIEIADRWRIHAAAVRAELNALAGVLGSAPGLAERFKGMARSWQA
jgi:hypothetical protein